MVNFDGAIPILPSEWVPENAREARDEALKEELQSRDTLLGAYLGENIDETTRLYFDANTWKEVPPARQNLIDRFIRRISLVYKSRPEYLYSDTDNFEDVTKRPDQKEYDELDRWIFMKRSERKTNLLGTSLLHPVARDDKMDRDYIWFYFPFFEQSNPKKLAAVLYPLNQSTVDTSQSNQQTWVFWSQEKHFLIKNGARVGADKENPEDFSNPLGIMPFVQVSTREKDKGLGKGYGEPLWDANTSINTTFTEMRLGVRFDLMGQWVHTGHGDTKGVKTGVQDIIHLPSDDTLTVVAPEADMSSAIEVIRAEYENAAQNLGLIIKWADNGEAASGISLKIQSLELLERREDDVAVWTMADRDLYDVEKVVAEKGGLKALPENRLINLAEIEFPVSPEEQQARDAADIAMGILTPAQILIRDNPDGFKNLEEAQKQIEENKAVNPAPARVSTRSAFERVSNGISQTKTG